MTYVLTHPRRWVAVLGSETGRRAVSATALVVVIAVLAGVALYTTRHSSSAHRLDADGSTSPSTSPSTSGPTSTTSPPATTMGPRRGKAAHLADSAAPSVLPLPDLAAAQFQVATLNLLGAGHTGRGGDKHGYASGPTRMRGVVRVLRAHSTDIVALQELEQPQVVAFRRLAGGYSLWNGDGKAHDGIAWNTSVFELEDTGQQAMPYFHGKLVGMPWVLLKHKATGREVYVVSLHNPISSARRGRNAIHRVQAKNIQANLVSTMRKTGNAVLLMGDFNERAGAFCRMTSAGLIAAQGGTASPCRPPLPIGIDWIFSTPNLAFAGYQKQRGGMAGLTDHPFVHATATYAGIPPLQRDDE